MDEEQGIYRDEVMTVMSVLSDINVRTRTILRYIEGEDDEEEEEADN